MRSNPICCPSCRLLLKDRQGAWAIRRNSRPACVRIPLQLVGDNGPLQADGKLPFSAKRGGDVAAEKEIDSVDIADQFEQGIVVDTGGGCAANFGAYLHGQLSQNAANEGPFLFQVFGCTYKNAKLFCHSGLDVF